MPYLGVTPAAEFTSKDLNGEELILDADGNTTITADTDDQIDIRIAGADDFSFKANTFEVQTGSNIDMNGTELILDANGNTSITADSDDQIDIKIAGADDFQFTANTMSVLSGSTLNIDSGATIANSGTATGFGLTGVTTGSGNVTITSGNLIVASGNGIDFSATADGTTMSSELFDDYEEGVFVTTLVVATSGSYTLDSSYDTLSYVKIGRVVFLRGYFNVSGESSPVGQLRISLPFTSSTDAEYGNRGYNTSVVFLHSGVGPGDGVAGWIEPNTTQLRLYKIDSSGVPSSLLPADVDSSFAVAVDLCYFT